MEIKQPMRDLMVVERVEVTNETSGGIILPGAATDTNTAKGKVLKTGPGKTDEKTGNVVDIGVVEGDTVLFHPESVLLLTERGVEPERYLIREEDVLAIVI